MRWEHVSLPFAFLLVLLCCRPACPQGQELQDRYSSIREKLTDLKKESELVTERLTLLSESLRESQKEAAEWEAQSTRLSESLTNINEQLNDCLLTIELQGQKLNRKTKAVAVLAGVLTILVVWSLAHLYFSHIRR